MILVSGAIFVLGMPFLRAFYTVYDVEACVLVHEELTRFICSLRPKELA